MVELYADGEEPGCDDLELLACASGGKEFEFVVNDYTDVQPNTDYFFVLHSLAARKFKVVGLADDGSVPIYGCSNPISCNYEPEFYFSDCPQLGCTDIGACNYSSSAGCDDGTCIYPQDLELQLYHDENYDGDNDYWDDDLGGVGSVVIEQDGEVVFTLIPNANGQAVVPDMPAGDYVAYFSDPSGVWTSNGQVEVAFPTCDEVEVGANPTPDTYDHYSDFMGESSTTLNCNSGLNLGFWGLEHRLRTF